MKTIIFCRDGNNISDFTFSEELDKFLNSPETTWLITNHLVIDELRARIREGKIAEGALKIQVQDLAGYMHDFIIDKNGRAENWQNSQIHFDDILNRLIF